MLSKKKYEIMKIYSKGARGLSVYLHNTASSQQIQFHLDDFGDSKGVVTPFMHVRTYPTRDFATLGPS